MSRERSDGYAPDGSTLVAVIAGGYHRVRVLVDAFGGRREMTSVSHAKLESHGRILVPREVRERLGVGPGDTVEFILDGDGVRIVAKRLSLRDVAGSVRRNHAAAADLRDQIQDATSEEAQARLERLGRL